MRFHTKGFTSLFLTIAFVALSLSGIVIYVAPRCRVADEMNWTAMGLQKHQWEYWETAAADCSNFRG
jgi:hypothetical protein